METVSLAGSTRTCAGSRTRRRAALQQRIAAEAPKPSAVPGSTQNMRYCQALVL